MVGRKKNLIFESVAVKRSWQACAALLGVVLGYVVLGAAGCVSSSERGDGTRHAQSRENGHVGDARDDLTDVTEEQLYGDLESGLDSPVWTEEEQNSKNVIDRALSQSPYRDFEQESFGNLDASKDWIASPKTLASPKNVQAKKGKKLADKSKKAKGARELKPVIEKEKSD